MQRTSLTPLGEDEVPPPPEPDRPRLLRRVLTSSTLILGLTVVAAVAVVANINFGKGKPPPDVASMSTNDVARQLAGYTVDPVMANAEASARKRAFEKEQALERAARKKAKLRAELAARKRAWEALKKRMSNNPTAQQNRQYARQVSADRGWGNCWDSLNTMWNHESGWNEHAMNPNGGAYGIPQALPGSKMSSAGPDWQNNSMTQIAWGLGYVAARYGDPCRAWDFWQAHHWY